MAAEPTPDEGSAPPCADCGTPAVSGASFCFECGGALAPPPNCPRCEEAVPGDAKFCPGCGAKLVGPRPPAEAPAAAAPAAKPAPAEVSAKEQVAQAAAELPPSKAPSSGIMGNVLLFVAILAVLLVVIYSMNKDSQKEHNPFDGPAPATAGAPNATPPASPPAAAAPPAAAGGKPVTGTVNILPEFKDQAVGTLFLVFRNAGSANRGPPLAVHKVDNPSFPLSFEIGPAQVMMPGMPFTGPFDVTARLDRDGNAMTKEAGDLMTEKAKAGVPAGTTGLTLVLNKRL